MPQSAAGYVHRIGRTGRAYNTGVAISLVSLLTDLTLILFSEHNLPDTVADARWYALYLCYAKSGLGLSCEL